MIPSFVTFLKCWDNDYLNDDSYLEDIDFTAAMTNSPEEMDIRFKYFVVDFDGYYFKMIQFAKNKAQENLLR